MKSLLPAPTGSKEHFMLERAYEQVKRFERLIIENMATECICDDDMALLEDYGKNLNQRMQSLRKLYNKKAKAL